jgi:hypothetical protein
MVQQHSLGNIEKPSDAYRLSQSPAKPTVPVMPVGHGESSQEKRAIDLEELDNSSRRSLFQLNSLVAHLP